MDYSKLSDFEINKAVAATLWPKCKTHNVGIQEPCVCVINDGGPVYSNYDPCNNPNHAWPIVTSKHIAVYPVSCMNQNLDYDMTGDWVASFSSSILSGADHKHKNPLRAAMIVYLMMEAA